MEGEEIVQIEGEETFRAGFPGGDEMKVIVDRSAAHSAGLGFLACG